jgi:hypothetical protein
VIIAGYWQDLAEAETGSLYCPEDDYLSWLILSLHPCCLGVGIRIDRFSYQDGYYLLPIVL